MHFYFSGVTDDPSFNILHGAGATRILVDPTDLINIPDEWPGSVVLDSGAYRAFKNGAALDVAAYIRTVAEIRARRSLAWATAPDVIGDPDATRANWLQCRRAKADMVPVWGWGASRALLAQYLDESGLVGIGGLVPYMRDKIGNEKKTKEQLAERDRMLQELAALCQQYPGRFHIFGIAWLKAIETLCGLVHSADSSVWLRPARYGTVIFVNTKTGHLSQAPTGLIPQYKPLKDNRAGRLALAAQEIMAYTEAHAAPALAGA